MIITIHQPEHLIWLGLIDKISQADVFVVLDNVQFRKNYFQNRNKIKTEDGEIWLTVPVKKHSLKTKIKDIKISQDWTERYLDLIRTNYKKAEFFNDYFPKLEKIILKKHKYLADLNLELIEFILKNFEVKTKIIKASDLKLKNVEGGSNIVLEICKNLSANTYISGVSGRDYLKLSDFKPIKVLFQDFKHPIYKQLTEPFVSDLSAIDLLFNYGPKSKNVLFSNNYNI